MNIIAFRSFCSTFAIAILGIIACGLPAQANATKFDTEIASKQPDRPDPTAPIAQTDTDLDVQPGRT